MGAMQGVHCYRMKSFYGRLSSILNNFDRGKTVTFSGLIREICYGEGRTARYKNRFSWFQPRSYNNTHGAERFFFHCHGAERISARRGIHGLLRSGYPPLKMSRSGADFSSVLRGGANTRRYKCHGAVRFDRTAPYKTAPRIYSHSVHIPEE